MAHTQGARILECQALWVQAQVYRCTAETDEDAAAVCSAVRTGLALATEVGALTWVPFLAEEQARLDADGAALSAVVAEYAAIGADGHAQRLLAQPPVVSEQP